MKVSIIGSGNVAWHLAKRFSTHCSFIEIVHRKKLASLWTDLPKLTFNSSLEVRGDSDLTLLAVSDHAIESVLEHYIIPENCVVVHTSGSVDMEILGKKNFSGYGVFYPLQSLTKGTTATQIPILIEGNTERVSNLLFEAGRLISDQVEYTDGKSRKKIHAAAVFASNFVNHQLALAEETLEDISLDILKPLVFNTVEKAFKIGPKKAQTGPALRQDQETMNAHLGIFTDSKQKELYKLMSEYIQNMHQK
jgi:predicted short-subunit dehydrogenase-like oxidoreductase (DUF2520 family)